MDPVAWTAIGIMAAAVFGSLFYLGGRIDALGARMDSRFDAVDARFANLDARFDAISDRLDVHIQRHTGKALTLRFAVP
jgi:hypothetical protein